MISFQQLARYVGAEPFRPFRISMASGQTFEIRHPEMVSVGRSNARISTFMSDDPEHARDYLEMFGQISQVALGEPESIGLLHAAASEMA